MELYSLNKGPWNGVMGWLKELKGKESVSSYIPNKIGQRNSQSGDRTFPKRGSIVTLGNFGVKAKM